MADYFRLDRAAAFLRAYQTALEHSGGLKPLDAVEIKYLPDMAAAGNIYVMEWALRDFYGREVDPVEYLGYLQHHICLMRWYEDRANRLKLEKMIVESTCPTGAIQHTAEG
jgi:homoserine kinase type II